MAASRGVVLEIASVAALLAPHYSVYLLYWYKY